MDKKKVINNLKYDLSIVVATYNPIKEKFFLTLNSLINQKNVNYEIIISDDGSKDNLFNEIKEYFASHNFNNYILLEHKENKGTVLNLYDGVIHSSGEYIKIISPGDYITDDYIMCDWIEGLKKSNKKWSFSDTYYYNMVDSQKRIIQGRALPQDVNSYHKNLNKKCKINYILYGDVVNGAATLCERLMYLEYFEVILNKIIYAEDIMYRVMMFDNNLPYYFHEKAVFYEYGSGISSSKNDKWTKILASEVSIGNKIMADRITNNSLLQNKIKRILKKKANRNFVLEYYFSFAWLKLFLKRKIFPRKTPIKVERRIRNENN